MINIIILTCFCLTRTRSLRLVRVLVPQVHEAFCVINMKVLELLLYPLLLGQGGLEGVPQRLFPLVVLVLQLLLLRHQKTLH